MTLKCYCYCFRSRTEWGACRGPPAGLSVSDPANNPSTNPNRHVQWPNHHSNCSHPNPNARNGNAYCGGTQRNHARRTVSNYSAPNRPSKLAGLETAFTDSQHICIWFISWDGMEKGRNAMQCFHEWVIASGNLTGKEMSWEKRLWEWWLPILRRDFNAPFYAPLQSVTFLKDKED